LLRSISNYLEAGPGVSLVGQHAQLERGGDDDWDGSAGAGMRPTTLIR
jgi:hypothetical protein